MNTRDLLHRRGMDLDSYSYDICILQLPETVAHLFIRCNFAKACWDSIGVHVIPNHQLDQKTINCPILHGDHYSNSLEHLDNQE